MNITRQIDVFDNQTENLVRETPIDKFDLETFKKRFEIETDDPLMYKPYEITTSTADLFPDIIFEFVDWAEDAANGISAGAAQQILKDYGYQIFYFNNKTKMVSVKDIIKKGFFMLYASKKSRN